MPIGLIGSNWGGTRIEPWTPPVGFKQVAALKDIADNLDKFPEKNEQGQRQSSVAAGLVQRHDPPLVPFAIRGAIWYQGESNNGEGMLYHEKMKALIAGWRSVWKNDDMPFFFVQLAPYRYGNDGEPAGHLGSPAADARRAAHRHGRDDRHRQHRRTSIPKNKQDVGKRLALWALANDLRQERPGLLRPAVQRDEGRRQQDPLWSSTTSAAGSSRATTSR